MEHGRPPLVSGWAGPRASSRRSTSSSQWAAQGDAKARRADRHRRRADGPGPDAALRSRSASCRAAPLSPPAAAGWGCRFTPAANPGTAPLPKAGDKGEQGGHGPRRRRAPARCSGARRTPGRGHMGAVDVVAGEVDQILHQLAAAAHEGTGHPRRLAKGPHLDVHAGRMNPWAARVPRPRPQHPNTVGIVDHQPVAALGSQCCKSSTQGPDPRPC